MTFRLRIAVMLPAYKEAENLEILLPKIHKAMKKIDCEYSVTVVDAMTKVDDTDEICGRNGALYLPRRGGGNYGDAVRTGISDVSGDYVVIMDADGSHDPEDIARMYDEIQRGFDVVIGSRYTAGGKSHNGFILKAMSLAVNYTYRLFFRIKAKDVSDSFRIYDAAKLKRLHLSCENFDIVEEILILLAVMNKDLKVSEIPIFFNKRLYGESKRDLFRFAVSYIGTIIRLYKLKKNAQRSLKK